ncbi:MAG: response regulator transcription factor [Saprospiraceae bacterium]|nr:response regulator transcription factor [Saprospiraceae bacterium]
MNSQLRCLVIDDDPLICDLIKHFCTKIPQVLYCISAGTGRDGLQVLSSQEINLIFLDYNLPDMKGEYLLELKRNKVPVIMVTSESEFAVKSYDYDDVLDFLVKPLSYERFYKAVSRTFNETLNASTTSETTITNPEFIFIKDGTKKVKVNFEDLLFLKSEGNYISFVTKEKSTLSLMTSKEIEDKLPTYFRRVHRSYIVNLKKVDSVSSEELSISKYNIPISQKHRKEVLDYIGDSENL